jgi:hypothetical protein
MLRTDLVAYLLAAAFLAVTIPGSAADEAKTSSWSSQQMRLTARPKVQTFPDELQGNCAGLTVMIKTRIEWLRALEAKAAPQQWPPPSAVAQWARRPVGGGIARHRERIAQLNAALGAKGCQTVDVQAELQRAPAADARTRRR